MVGIMETTVDKSIKAGDIVKVKTWEEIKKVHGGTLNEDHPAHKSVCDFLKRHAGKKRTVKFTKRSEEYEQRIYIQEDDKMYLVLPEIKRTSFDMKIKDDLFEL